MTRSSKSPNEPMPHPSHSSSPLSLFSPPSNGHVSLPERVEGLIEQICMQQNKDPPNDLARLKLSRLSEERSIDILGKMAKRKIRNFSKFLTYMVAKSPDLTTQRNDQQLASRDPNYNTNHDVGNLVNSPHTPEKITVNSTRATSSTHAAEFRTGANRNGKSMVQTRLNFESPFNLRRAVDNAPRTVNLPSLDGDNRPELVQNEEMDNAFNFRHTPNGNLVNSPIETSTPQAQLGFESPVNVPTVPVIAPPTPLNGHNLDRELIQRADKPKVTASKEMLALGELYFRKAFLILNYLRGDKLEKYISLEFVQSMKYIEMDVFESIIWSIFGHKLVPETERIKHKNVDWNSDRTHVYHCHVDLQGHLTFKGPYLKNERTHLQRALGDDNILEVKFEEEIREERKGYVPDFVSFYNYCMYHIVAEDGIGLGLRRYRFYGSL